MPSLLARFAGHSFWLARYMERAENLARLLDVNETFAEGDPGAPAWQPIVELHADGERFFARHAEATADAVARFYVLERDNPSSIISAAAMARENGRALRHLISTEMWQHLNDFNDRLLALRPADLHLSHLSRLCRSIKEDCQLHTGIVEGTYYRDQGWVFYEIGKWVERMDQTTRLLDIHFQPEAFGAGVAGGRSPPHDARPDARPDARQWNALLRSLAGYHAFRRTYPRGMEAADVVAFLVLDRGFPRSLRTGLERLASLLDRLIGLPELGTVQVPMAGLEALAGSIVETDVQRLAPAKMHDFLDRVQQQLIALTDELEATFFGRGR